MCSSPTPAPDHSPADPARLTIGRWEPQPMVAVAHTEIPRPQRPAIDAHNHLGRWLTADHGWMTPDLPALLDIMDQRDITHIVNLDGRWGSELTDNLERYDRAYPERFSTFCHLDWSAFTGARPTATLIDGLQAAAAAGAKGIKVWKDLGLHVRDAAGALVMPDDRRLLPVWHAAGELGLPICIHTADPVAFFEPLDRRNERLDELGVHPEWWFGDRDRFPAFHQLIDHLEGAIAASPATRFMGAHVGGYAENLEWVDRMLATYPNFAVDIGARLGELGRQPRRFRKLVVDHPQQIIFGTDTFPVDSESYAVHFRFLESADEYFPYWPGGGQAPQGRWHISGVHLPADLLDQLYDGNARRFLGVGGGP